MKENIERIVYYDGVCGLCDGFVELLVKLDKNKKLKFSSLQGKSGRILLNKLNLDLEEFDTVLFKVNDQVYTKSTAVFKIINSIGGIIKLFLVFKLLPRRFNDWIYSKVAKNRFKIFGKLDKCDISKFNKPGQFIE
jgi:predicted DCC family thiol-disulfide oxidoreductase YuxK